MDYECQSLNPSSWKKEGHRYNKGLFLLRITGRTRYTSRTPPFSYQGTDCQCGLFTSPSSFGHFVLLVCRHRVTSLLLSLSLIVVIGVCARVGVGGGVCVSQV